MELDMLYSGVFTSVFFCGLVWKI